ncbi:MAG: YitT family protein [Ruminococcus sp.]|nr:YitT family protein [Ruminococcus sp.]
MKLNINFKEEGKRFLVICAASVLIALNIKTFVRTGGLYPSGLTGISILLQTVADQYFNLSIPYSFINLILNSVPVYVGFRYIGKKFTLYSCLTIVLTSILTDLIPGFQITYDPLLISIFGGMINGLAVSWCLRVDATSGGMDFVAIYFSEKKGVDSWNMILGLNAVILLIAGYLFGWDKALYSIIFQYLSTQVLNMLHRKYQKKTLFIVTNKPNEVCKAIDEVSKHGATIIKGEGSYEHRERSIVYSVVSSAESDRVVRAVKLADENSFVNALRTDQLSGRFYQRPTR